MEQIFEKLFDILKKIPRSYYLPILLVVAAMIFFGVGLIQLLSANKQTSLAVAKNSAQTQKPPITSSFGIQVDIEGAVMHPGVYTLPPTSRVQDGLIAAGGLSQDANRDAVAKGLNLAAKLSDGAKVYIPSVADTTQNQELGIMNQGSQVLGAQTGLVNINTASQSDLDALPGIGPVTAQKIISARPFSSVDDLLTKKAVTKSTFTKIKDLVTTE